MKKISREEQMMKNGGYWWHCHIHLLDYKAKNKDKAEKKAKKHASTEHKGMVNVWGTGLLANCKYY